MKILDRLSLQKIWVSLFLKNVAIILLGIVGLSLCSHIKIPVGLVPWTLQTFGLIVLALSVPPRQAFLSVAGWITMGMIGYPMFCSQGPGIVCGMYSGYIWGFLLVTPAMAYFFRQFSSYTGAIIISLLGSKLILFCGYVWLSFWLGDGLKAWQTGVVPFVFSGTIKAFAAVTLTKGLQRARHPY